MSSTAGHTAGPFHFRIYGQEPEDIAFMEQHGMKPTRMLTNEGQVAIMAGTGDDVKRIALIDCQSKYKRGEGYRAECEERDANARLIAAAPELLAALEKLLEEATNFSVSGVYFDEDCMGHKGPALARAAIAKATGAS